MRKVMVVASASQVKTVFCAKQEDDFCFAGYKSRDFRISKWSEDSSVP